MTTYAIGDVQGCFVELQRLLDKISFDAARDQLWFVGDLVNRGPDSLSTLRFVKKLGEQAITVLGNHDLHLLMVAEGSAKPRKNDTLQEVLAAPDRKELLDWLRRQRLMYARDSFAMVHAGLLPSWSVEKALALAREVEQALQAENYRDLLARMYGNHPLRWSDDLHGIDRLRVIINAMTRLRVCSEDGVMEFAHKGKPENAPRGYLPWFELPGRLNRDATIICGHWSALGLLLRDNLVALDTGCLWGGNLSAVSLENRRVFQVSCGEQKGSDNPQ
ncbi:MAG TPA: symmetrical bis(5'-nucleosyl)-tetraphosphatase [Burkholderiales bacterium]|nr:symmetrical bis(5'-nucleosyl)-tetraphosphatase [Burkholderiales bacterium]